MLQGFNLLQNYPNPFNPVTTITFSLNKQEYTKLVIYNSMGERINTIIEELMEPGDYKVTFDASKYSSGIYFYSLETANSKLTKKMIYLK